MPASAISFSRSQMVSSSPGWPGLAWRGARLVDDLKCALPKPPLPPSREPHAVAGLQHLAQQRLLVLGEHLRAGRHGDHRVLARRAGAVLAHAARAALGLEVLAVAVVDQRVEVGDALHPHVAALAAVAAVGAAELDELLAPERDAAGPAGAGGDVDLGLVEEFHERCEFRPSQEANWAVD